MATYEIRKELGEDVVATRGDDVVLDPLLVNSDLADFEAAAAAGDHDAALALYRGPFLDGFFLGESVAFDQWMEGERARLTALHRRLLVERAEAIEAAGDPVAAADAWRQAANADRFDSRVALRLLRALDAAGNRAGALQFARIHEALLGEEFGTTPDPEFVRAVEEVRNRTAATTTPPAPPSPRSAPPGKPAAPEAPARSGDEAAPTSPTSPTSAASPRDAAPRDEAARSGVPARPVIAAVAVFFLLAAIAGYISNRLATRGPEDAVRVAVLPFSTPEPADVAFADGLSEEIMDALANVEGIRVPAWSASVAVRGVEAPEAAERLGVDHVVEGRVRREGDSLRIRVQLSGPDGFATWTRSYDRSAGEVFATWDEIARAVLEALQVELGGRRTVADEAGGTRDVVAYDLFVKGRHAWFKRTPEGLAQAIAYFRQAVARDPGYARAHAGLADAYNLMGAYDYGVLPPDSAFPVALAAAERALELAPDLGEAHAARANALFAYYRDMDAADAAYRRAIALYPHYPEAHHWYSLFLTARGDREGAMREARRAIELDSLSAVMRTSMARHLYFRGDAPAALAAYRRALDIDPTFVTAHLGAGITLLELDRPDDALAAFDRALELIDRPHPLSLALSGLAHARAGRPAEARALLDRLLAMARAGAWVPPEYLALVHLGLDDRDAALAAFERAVETRSSAVPFFGIEPLARPLWGDPRFRALAD